MTGRVRCGTCTLFHRDGYAVCPGVTTRTWPVADLLAAFPDHPGIETNQLHRYELSGIPEPVADRWATRLGLHPVQVWGWEWVDAGLSVTDRQYLDSGWRQAWEHSEALQPCDLPSVAPLDPSPHPSTETHIETLTTQHRRSA